MTRTFLAWVILCIPLTLPAQNTAGWQLVWSDEFSGPANSAPDGSKWTYDLGTGAPALPGWGNSEWEVYTNSTANAYQDGAGNLVIRALATTGGPGGYTSARLKTKDRFAFKYGIVTARIKIPYAQGIWPAFWMLGGNYPATPWPDCGEIDIMENFGVHNGDASANHGTLHGPGYSGGNGITQTYNLPGGAKFADDFHVFSIQWQPAGIEFFVDGVSYHRVTPASLPQGASWVFDNAFFMILNLAVGGSPAPVGYPDGSTAFPQQMLIDYVRIYAPPTRFVAVTPCRVADTRNSPGTFGGPVITGGSAREFPISSSACGIPMTAAAYSLNVTAVPRGPLGYLTIWPSGQSQPFVSTLNSDGRIKANGAIVPAGVDSKVGVFVTNDSDVVLDVNGYFDPSGSLAFYPVPPCRVVDTRNAAGVLGGPAIGGGQSRTFPITQSNCGLPANAQAFSLNFTAVPRGPLSYLTTWPAGGTQPFVSTLNSFAGTVVANAAIVPAGAGGISVFVTDPTDIVIDANGYFAPPGAAGALSYYSLRPCRISDTRNAQGTFGGPSMSAGQSRAYPVVSSACNVPAVAKAYALNATVVPPAPLSYLTLWPSDAAQPFVSTLNSFDGSVVANEAIVPASSSSSISAYVTNATDLILDISGYFAP